MSLQVCPSLSKIWTLGPKLEQLNLTRRASLHRDHTTKPKVRPLDRVLSANPTREGVRIVRDSPLKPVATATID